MPSLFRTSSNFALFAVILLGLSACGGGGDAAKALGTTGSVGILLTDQPADPDLFEEINITIESIDLLGGESDGRVSIYDGPNQTINLLALKNESIPFSFVDDIPAGDYCKIRLTLSNLELVLADETPENDADNERHYPNLPGNNKLDLNVRDCFAVESGETLTLQLDIDAGRSIHVHESGNGYRFRPVVFVDHVTPEFSPKMVRLSGVLRMFDSESGSFLLCDTMTMATALSNACVQIETDENSAFFDNIDYSGAARSLDEIFDEENLETRFTVVGWPSLQAPSYEQDDDLESEQNAPMFLVNALVIEEGEFLQVQGSANNDADAAHFYMATDPVSPINADNLYVEIQADQDGIKGTRFVSKSGQLMSYEDVVTGIGLQVDGVLEVLSETSTSLKSALVIVDPMTITSESITGTVTSVDPESILISVDNDTVCGAAIAQLDMDPNQGFELLTVTVTDSSSSINQGGEFATGQSVGISGSCSGSTFTQISVVIVQDERL